jgi:hypothetical protein
MIVLVTQDDHFNYAKPDHDLIYFSYSFSPD